MNEPQDTNVQPQALDETPLNAIPQNPPEDIALVPKKKSSRAFRFILPFLLGAITYAVIAGAYNFINNQNKAADADTSIPSAQYIQNQAAVQQQAQAAAKISDNDLAKYANPDDCTKQQEYSNLKVVLSLMQITSINLYDGMQLKSLTTSGIIAKWNSLPKVLDYQCKEIKITDLNISDRVNVYSPKTNLVYGDAIADIQVIQKANK